MRGLAYAYEETKGFFVVVKCLLVTVSCHVTKIPSALIDGDIEKTNQNHGKLDRILLRVRTAMKVIEYKLTNLKDEMI